MSETHSSPRAESAQSIAERAQALRTSIAVAESLTGGQVCAALAAAPDAAEWFTGGVVAYNSGVKYDLLNVPVGPVVSEPAARAMADGVRGTHCATYAVALTGAGGPDPQDGREPGTVFLAVASPHGVKVEELHLPGDPGQVCQAAVEHALAALDSELARAQSKMSG